MRHPHGLRAASGGDLPVVLGTIAWSTNNISTATISGLNFTATETTAPSNSSAQSTALPAVTTTGWYLDWVQVEGYSAYVNFVGVANSTANLAYDSTATKTWYWSGDVYGLSASGESGPGALAAGTYRLAVRLESGSPKIYFRKGSTVTAPLVCPSGTLYFITQTQGGYKTGDITIANAGAVYEGGGGLF
jgi:hypothetical protein